LSAGENISMERPLSPSCSRHGIAGLAMPPSITIEIAKGFTLYLGKAVVIGRADEVIDLARTNLWR
jgi:hypothetical protein